MSTQRPLSPRQRSSLTLIARQGWQILTKAGAIDEAFDDWRRREAEAACGFTISAAPSSMFDALAAHFFALAGKPEKALEIAMEPTPNDVRQVLFLVQQERSRQGLSEAYVSGISKAMFKKPTPETVGEARGVLFALIRRRQRARQNGQ
jgi:hypothetical protein